MAGDSEAGSAVDLTAAVRVGRWSLDAARSSVEFHVKHFWGLITVHGHFEGLEGEGSVGPDGTIAGRLVIDASSLTTRNRKRDEHLRSADFFDVEHHPHVVVTVRELVPAGPSTVRGRVALAAAGHEQEFEVTMAVLEASADAVTLRGELVADRTAYAMTWSPLGMASKEARGVVSVRFVRS